MAINIVSESLFTKLITQYNSAKLENPHLDVECEVRFCDVQERLINGVPYYAYDNLMKELIKNCRGVYTLQHHIDYIMNNKDDNRIRYTEVFENGFDDKTSKVIRVVKNNKFNESDMNYGLRFNVATETTEDVDMIPTDDLTMIRKKARSKFVLANCVIDLTDITITELDQQQKSYKKYEVELELTGNITYPVFEKALRFCYITMSKSQVVFSMKERNTVIADFNKLISSKNTSQLYTLDTKLMANARNMSMEDLRNGLLIGYYRKHPGEVPMTFGPTQGPYYTVSVKADGKRCFLYYHEKGIFFLSTPNQVSKIRSVPVGMNYRPMIGTILEGEYIPRNELNFVPEEMNDSHQGLYLVYDILASGNNNDIQSFIYEERYRKATNSLGAFPNNIFHMTMKDVHMICDSRDFFNYNREMLNKLHPYKNDGLVYTPNLCYNAEPQNRSGCYNILKWKPIDELTIDFRIIKKGSSYMLMYLDTNKKTEVPFSGSIEHPFLIENFEVPADIQKYIGLICEMEYVQGKLRIKKIRADKMSPNGTTTVVSTWNDIHNPITKELILGLEFGLIYKHHNDQKTDLYQYLNSQLSINKSGPYSLLCIGSGRGGDLSKWIRHSFNPVITVEPNESNLQELERRANLLKEKITHYPLNTIGQDVETIIDKVKSIHENNHIDAIVYMLSLTFFFDNKESTTSISDLCLNCLREQGYLAFLTMDGKKVKSYFSNIDNYEYVSPPSYPVKGKRANLTQIDMILIDDKKLYIHIPNSIVEHQYEYLTDLDYLDKLLQANGLQKVHHIDLDGKSAFLNEEEYIFNRLFTACVYMKGK